jgi:hypothetical protein
MSRFSAEDQFESIDLTADEEEDNAYNLEDENPEVSYRSEDIDVYGLVRRIKHKSIYIPRFGERQGPDNDTEGFQREFIWTNKQIDRFIESIFLGYPIPAIFLVKLSDQRRIVLDGQQRLQALTMFHSDNHKIGNYHKNDGSGSYVLAELSGKKFSNLSESEKLKFEDYIMQVITLEATPRDNKNAIYNIYERINSGGTPLTAHEIRVALYAGEVVRKISELNDYGNWREIYSQNFNKRLRDHELVSRVLALYEGYEKYMKPLKKFLNDYYMNSNESSENLDKSSLVFKRACDVIVDSGVGRSAMRPRDDNRINIAWFDSFMVAVMRNIDMCEQNKGDSFRRAYERYSSSVNNEYFDEYFTGATTDTFDVIKRINYALENFNLEDD